MAIHVAITRRVREGREAEFQQALRSFLHASMAQQGVLGVHMLTPAPGDAGGEYGILRTFANEAERDGFYGSALYRDWLERVDPLVDGDCERRELTGLEAWFRGTGAPPPRWKMATATLVGVYPTSLLLSGTIGEVAHDWPFLLRNLAVAIGMVGLLTWVVMPFVTRSLRGWLHGTGRKESA